MAYLRLDQPEAAEPNWRSPGTLPIYPDTFRTWETDVCNKTIRGREEYSGGPGIESRGCADPLPLAWIYFQREEIRPGGSGSRGLSSTRSDLAASSTKSWLQIYQAQGDRVNLLIYSRARKAVPEFGREWFPSLAALEQEILKNTS